MQSSLRKVRDYPYLLIHTIGCSFSTTRDSSPIICSPWFYLLPLFIPMWYSEPQLTPSLTYLSTPPTSFTWQTMKIVSALCNTLIRSSKLATVTTHTIVNTFIPQHTTKAKYPTPLRPWTLNHHQVHKKLSSRCNSLVFWGENFINKRESLNQRRQITVY